MDGNDEKGDRLDVHENYELQARKEQTEAERKNLDRTFQLKAFNNWIKSVLISRYTALAYEPLKKKLDFRKGANEKILHVLDIGCGRGQDIKKWQLAPVKYMVATDFSEECLKTYEERWVQRQPYKLYTVAADFTKFELYRKIEHSYYDIVSAQFCLHYMFKSRENVETGLTSILSNLLIQGYFIATIPDSYTILKKIKERGIQRPDGSREYHNKCCSIKIEKTHFTEPFGNAYGFYLENAVGSKDEETGEIKFTYEYLISLDHLDAILKNQGMVEVVSKNFIEFYNDNREEYKHLFAKLGLNFDSGQHIDPELWEVIHLYRVLVYRKEEKGKDMSEFDIGKRLRAIDGKEIRRHRPNDNQRGGNRNPLHSDNRSRDRSFNSQRNSLSSRKNS